MAALIVRFVERVPATVAISFLQAPALAAVDRSAARQAAKVAARRHRLLMVVHAVGPRPIVTLRLRGTAVIDLPAVRHVVRVARAVLARQAAVEILRRVNRLAQGLAVSAAVIAIVCAALGARERAADVVTAFGTATQVFAQPLSYTTTAAAAATVGVAVVMRAVRLAGLASATWTTKPEIDYRSRAAR